MKTALPAAAASLDINVLNEVLAHSKFLSAYAFEVVSCSPGVCTVRAPYQPLLDRPGGIVSGLTYMGVADVAMWLAIMTLRGPQESWVTSDLKTAFLKSARQEDIFCSARVLRAGNAVTRPNQPAVEGRTPARRCLATMHSAGDRAGGAARLF